MYVMTFNLDLVKDQLYSIHPGHVVDMLHGTGITVLPFYFIAFRLFEVTETSLSVKQRSCDSSICSGITI